MISLLQFNFEKWESEVDEKTYTFRYWNTDDNDHMLSVDGEIFPVFKRSTGEGWSFDGGHYDFQFDGKDAALVIIPGEKADVAVAGTLLRSGLKWQKNPAYSWVSPAIGLVIIIAGTVYSIVNGGYSGTGSLHLLGMFMVFGLFNPLRLLRKLRAKVRA